MNIMHIVFININFNNNSPLLHVCINNNSPLLHMFVYIQNKPFYAGDRVEFESSEPIRQW